MNKRFIARVSRKEFVLLFSDSEEGAVLSVVTSLDMENRSKVLPQCYEYRPDDLGNGLEGPLFSDDHTNPPFKPNWLVRHGRQAERLKE
jgi:hypothetical protein